MYQWLPFVGLIDSTQGAIILTTFQVAKLNLNILCDYLHLGMLMTFLFTKERFNLILPHLDDLEVEISIVLLLDARYGLLQVYVGCLNPFRWITTIYTVAVYATLRTFMNNNIYDACGLVWPISFLLTKFLPDNP